MVLIRGGARGPGYSLVVGPQNSDLKYIEFGLLSLSEAEIWEHTFPGRETVLVVLSGSCDIQADGARWENVGRRADVFDGKPSAAYLPPGGGCQVSARGELEIAVCAALAEKGTDARLIAPEQIQVRRVGAGSFYREIYDIAVEDGAAERLLVGETYNQPGLWSSYPPHKHDVHNPPEETKLEEVYHYRVKPSQGFGVQRIYGDGFDETHAVQDRDTVTISKGFHPVAAAPGYQLYYLWVLAGEQRAMCPRDDPLHSWVSSES